MNDALKCPVCGKHHFRIKDFYEICPVCGWEDDSAQRLDTDYCGGANRYSLNEARKRFLDREDGLEELFLSAFKTLAADQVDFLCKDYDITKDELFGYTEDELDSLFSSLEDVCDYEDRDEHPDSTRYAKLNEICDALELAISRREDKDTHEDGGPGSGNWGHAGRPGQRGGSEGGGGVHNRLNAEGGGYTSFSKEKKKYATPHKTNAKELGACPDGTKVLVNGESYLKNTVHQVGDEDYLVFVNQSTGEKLDELQMMKQCKDNDVRLAIPDSANKNFKKPSGELNGFDPSAFSPERKSNAFSTGDRRKADEAFRENSGEIWRGCTEEQKVSLYKYTGSEYRSINGALRGVFYSDDETDAHIKNMTEVIGKSELSMDTWLTRGCSASAAEKLFGISEGTLMSSDPSEFVNRSGMDKGFLSCGTARGTGFMDNDVVMNIYCPKGTKGIYAEPFSALCSGDGLHWDEENSDGLSGQEDFSSEFETILQRGSKLQITNCGKEHGQIKMEVQVIAQNPEENWH